MPGQGGEGHPMRSKRPTDQPDPPAHPDDLAQDVRIRPMTQRAFVEAVDLALDVLDQLEVVGQHFVGDRGDEARGIEGAKARLTLRRGVEPRERGERLVVDRHDPVPAGHDVDRATDQLRFVQLTIVRRRLGDLEEQVDVLGIERQVGPIGRVGQPLQRLGLEADGAADGIEISALAPLHVDPQQLLGADARRHRRFELDLAVASVGVVEPGPRAGPRLARGDQRSDASRAAATIARKASTYCKASIDRSRRLGASRPLPMMSCPLERGWSTIDISGSGSCVLTPICPVEHPSACIPRASAQARACIAGASQLRAGRQAADIPLLRRAAGA